ncbi:MAG: hypothetical protein A2104_08695 [Candidatus Melainabacteria bacterium GWF2_32_7]|nr:MAG: hypothetical protein A2104_08695 [Candidatus Melainabacteria bacterium GWF2_32_7]OGI22695.1 MAG: hypothetical protein A2255_06980 [Candidatus Melainabacteria bacterium RIFOXYA2_FULL_32_9]
MQTSEPLNKSTEKTVNDYIELIETIARIEYTRLKTSSHLIDYSELVNIGAIAVYVILTNSKYNDFNISYMSTAIKWAIRNELRRRYKWYAFKHPSHKEDTKEVLESSGELEELDQSEIREVIYGAILSIDDLADAENPVQIKDSSLTPEESLEFRELNKAVKNAMKYLPPREKMVLETRFYKGKKIKEIADDLKISSSRVSRIIQSGLDKIKENLRKQELI